MGCHRTGARAHWARSHCSTIDKRTLLLVRGLGDVALVRIQHPFAASDISEPPSFELRVAEVLLRA